MSVEQSPPRPGSWGDESGHRGDLREFLSHAVGAVVVVCGLFFLLGYMYLDGTADPQANARYLPVAVVNQDEGATLDTPIGPRRMAVGQQISDGLLHNNDWRTLRLHPVDAQAAEAGLRDGTYYGVVRMPADLSRQVAGRIESVTTESGQRADPPEPARVVVEYSPRMSVVSGQVMYRLADALQDSLRERMGTQILDQARLLAEAEQHTVGAAGELVLRDPVRVEVTQWNPLPEGVSNASLPLFYALVVVLAGFTGAMVISSLLDARLGFIPLEVGPFAFNVHVAPIGRLHTLLRKWAVTIVTAPLVSGIYLGIAHVVGITGFDPWAMFWFAVLGIAAVGICAHTIIAAIGNAGLLVNLVVFVVLGIPTSGGATPTHMLPPLFRAIGSVEPMHQAFLGLRSIMFFDSAWSAGLGHAVWVLGAWGVAGVVGGVLVTIAYDRMGLERQAIADRVRANRRAAAMVGELGSIRRVRIADAAAAGGGEAGQIVEGDATHRE